jgi:hypothetical protein
MVDVEGRLATQLLGVMLVKRRKVQLREGVEQEEHQIVFGQRLAWRNGLLAALLGVPGAVVLATIFHDAAPVCPFESAAARYNPCRRSDRTIIGPIAVPPANAILAESPRVD